MNQGETLQQPTPQEIKMLEALFTEERYPEAEVLARKMTGSFPHHGFAWLVLGAVFQQLGRIEEALAVKLKAVEMLPGDADAHSNLGNTLKELGRPDEAATSYRRALEIKPDFVEVHRNLGVTLLDLGQLDDAVTSYRRALLIKPDYPEVRANLGIALLLLGNFKEGFRCYESRLDPAMRKHLLIPSDPAFPQWQGQDLAGKTLLVRSEQGLGDQIQFCRYLLMLKARGTSRITLVCQAPLKALFERFTGADEVLTMAETENAPNHDYWTLPLSLPPHCNTTLDNVPAEIPYLYADEKLRRDMAKRLADVADFKVGVCWKGSKAYKGDADRSVGLAPFKKLFELDGVRFFTLQAGSREEFCAVAGDGAFDLGHELDALTPPFEETAALIMNLDLVITCDTSIGHLAGALGKTVWVVLPFVPDWRWMMDREDSPWYPNTRLFRQTRRGDWEELFARVAQRLKAVVAGQSPALWPVAGTSSAQTSRIEVAKTVHAPISVGELLDKITILEIKVLRISDEAKRANVAKELEVLRVTADTSLKLNAEGLRILDQLRQVNSLLWDVEDGIRECERNQDFGSRFVELARSVYHHNDRRALLKKQLNQLTGSDLVEEKSYSSYRS